MKEIRNLSARKNTIQRLRLGKWSLERLISGNKSWKEIFGNLPSNMITNSHQETTQDLENIIWRFRIITPINTLQVSNRKSPTATSSNQKSTILDLASIIKKKTRWLKQIKTSWPILKEKAFGITSLKLLLLKFPHSMIILALGSTKKMIGSLWIKLISQPQLRRKEPRSLHLRGELAHKRFRKIQFLGQVNTSTPAIQISLNSAATFSN